MGKPGSPLARLWCVVSNTGVRRSRRRTASSGERVWFGGGSVSLELLQGNEWRRLDTSDTLGDEGRDVLWVSRLSPCTPPLEPVGCAVVKMLEPEPAWSRHRSRSRFRRPEELPPSTAAAGAAVPAIGWAPAPFSFFKNGVSSVRIFAIATKTCLPNELDVALPRHRRGEFSSPGTRYSSLMSRACSCRL
jgi:hypothetical protein